MATAGGAFVKYRERAARAAGKRSAVRAPCALLVPLCRCRSQEEGNHHAHSAIVVACCGLGSRRRTGARAGTTRRSRSAGRRSTVTRKPRSTSCLKAQAGVRDLYERADGLRGVHRHEGRIHRFGRRRQRRRRQQSDRAAHVHADGDGRYRPRYRRAALQPRDAVRDGGPARQVRGRRLGSRARRPKPSRARKASPCGRASSTGSRSTRSRRRASWPMPTSAARSSGSTTSCVSSQCWHESGGHPAARCFP